MPAGPAPSCSEPLTSPRAKATRDVDTGEIQAGGEAVTKADPLEDIDTVRFDAAEAE